MESVCVCVCVGGREGERKCGNCGIKMVDLVLFKNQRHA